MQSLTINSRKLGKEFHFTMRDEGGYVWLDTPDGDRKQICYGGYFMGDTVLSRPEDFEKDCRRWYRSHLKNNDWSFDG